MGGSNIANKGKIYIAGHKGMVGSAILRKLESLGERNIIVKSHNELDLTNQAQVNKFFDLEKPSQVYLAAAKVGGIISNNTYPADFIYQNIMIQANVINAAWVNGVDKLLFLGSSCIYPKFAEQPICEDALLSGALEPTNEPYAVAKIAGIKLCESFNRQYGVDYRSIMPTNLYGPGDNYHPENSHVIPALIRKFHEGKKNNKPEVIVWGTGQPKREFLYVDDLADASVYVMNLNKQKYYAQIKPMQSHLNIGYGEDLTILELAKIISGVVGYSGRITFDSSKPDGSPKKLMNSSRINSLGWKASFHLKEGLEKSYEDFLNRNIL